MNKLIPALVGLMICLSVTACDLNGSRQVPAGQETSAITIATASNFRPVLADSKSHIARTCALKIGLISASTGALLAQITQGADFDMVFAADPVISQKTGIAGVAIATAPLAYWQKPGADQSRPVAIANPKTAPFGRAAMQSIHNSVTSSAQNTTQSRRNEAITDLVYGASAAQAFAFVHTGAARAGYVPLSLLYAANIPSSQYELIDNSQYEQVLIELIAMHPAPKLDCVEREFRSAFGRGQLHKYGYDPHE